MADIKPDITKEIIARWQIIVDLMAEVTGVASGLITKFTPPHLETFVASRSAVNPLNGKVGIADLYCKEVVENHSELLIADALKDKKWANCPALDLGLTYYLGFPLLWPDGDVFGTICVLDYKDNPIATASRDLLTRFRQIIENDLRAITEAHEHKRKSDGTVKDREHISSLAVQLSTAAERDKRYLAEGLHDDIIQPLLFLKIKAGSLLKTDKDAGRSEIYCEIRDVIDELVEQARIMGSELSCPVLGQMGLEAAVKQWLLKEVQGKHDLKTTFNSKGLGSYSPSRQLSTLLFNAVKELVFNVVQHAEADCVEVSMIGDRDNLVISVKDDGKGFDADNNNILHNGRRGYGLLNIRLRLESIGGSLIIGPARGKGTEVIMTIPLTAEL